MPSGSSSRAMAYLQEVLASKQQLQVRARAEPGDGAVGPSIAQSSESLSDQAAPPPPPTGPVSGPKCNSVPNKEASTPPPPPPPPTTTSTDRRVDLLDLLTRAPTATSSASSDGLTLPDVFCGTAYLHGMPVQLTLVQGGKVGSVTSVNGKVRVTAPDESVDKREWVYSAGREGPEVFVRE